MHSAMPPLWAPPPQQLKRAACGRARGCAHPMLGNMRAWRARQGVQGGGWRARARLMNNLMNRGKAAALAARRLHARAPRRGCASAPAAAGAAACAGAAAAGVRMLVSLASCLGSALVPGGGRGAVRAKGGALRNVQRSGAQGGRSMRGGTRRCLRLVLAAWSPPRRPGGRGAGAVAPAVNPPRGRPRSPRPTGASPRFTHKMVLSLA